MGKRWGLVLLAVTGLVGANGCSSMNHTERGALGGGAIGTALGAAVGSNHGRTGTGAAIGGALGAVAGAAIGNSADQDERHDRAMAAAASAPVRGPLSMDEVVKMAQSGVSDATIVNQIQTSGTRYRLDGDTIVWLQQNNVSEPVIRAMQDTNRYAPPPRTVVVRDPYYYERPVVYQPVYVRPRPVYVAPPPGPSFGFSYTHIGR